MRWSSFLVPFSLLSAGVLAASEGASKQFTEFHKKFQATSPIKLDDASYKQLTALPRDYSAAILLTATDPRFQCQMCREFGPDWALLSRSWAKGDKSGDSKVIFSTLDFNDGRDTFMSLGLQTAPVLLLFQPTTGEFAVAEVDPLRFDFNTGRPTAESVRDWIVRHTPGRPHPEFSRPVDYFSWLIGLVAVAGIGTFISLAWTYIEMIVFNRRVWRFGCLLLILLYTAGYMFNNIRGTPYAGQSNGRISYIAGGFQTQFQIETQIIGFLYGALGFTAIMLADKVPRISDPKIQQLTVIVTVGAMYALYSFLLSIFKVKNGGYPFSLPPF